jgi:hypothetical protein
VRAPISPRFASTAHLLYARPNPTRFDRASLVEWAEQVGRVRGEAPAFILDLDEYAVGTGADSKRHDGARPSELERVLQQVSDHRTEDLSVGLDRDSVLNGHHGERDARSSASRRAA